MKILKILIRNSIKNSINNKRGMLLIEFIIYFPIVFVAFFGFLMTSLMITQRVVLDRAVANATAGAANWMSTSLHQVGQPDAFMGSSDPVAISTNPFRWFTFNHFYPLNRAAIENRIEELVVQQASLGITGGLAGEVQVEVIYNNFAVAGDLIVNATQRINFPVNLSLIGINARYIELRSSASARVFRPVVVFNDVHGIFDMIRYFTRGAVDITSIADFVGNIPNVIDNWFVSLTRGFGEPRDE